MPQLAHWFFRVAVVFFIVGVMMGLQMSITGVYNVTGAHAHTNLLGWVTSAIFGGFYALNPAISETRLAQAHFWVHTIAVAIMTPALYLMFYGYTALEPVLAIASLVAFANVLLFAFIVFSAGKSHSRPLVVPAE